ncbi:MlaD family protein [Antrihabitans stalactiti]|uniref:MCE family protein n=1 Tax=Antrihabitans stalactiti TaxID=2584121 RepID=A0A848KEG0_9NOCA|nr:MlaD family protein [Antrihabitans stalactiti]NMN96689.1 MCE family protein [Antrihabitans stalactiti]
MTKNNRVKLVVASAGALCLVGAASVVLVGLDSTERQTGFCAEMPDAVGLYEGNPVTQMGFEVGRVDHIEDKGDHVEVTFALGTDRSYPADVKAVTRSKSILADRSLELVGNYDGGGPELVRDNCISLGNSFTPKSISEIAGSAADFLDAMSPNNGGQALQTAIAGFDDAMKNNGAPANDLMHHAAAAMSNPDKFMADIASSIKNMGPLTEETLQKWAEIRSILDQAPEIVSSVAYDLMPGVEKVCYGIGWLVATLYDIQQSYGDTLWPFVHGGVTDVIHLAATRSKDIRELLTTIPVIAAFMRQQATPTGEITMTFQQPQVNVGVHGVPDMPLLNLLTGGIR